MNHNGSAETYYYQQQQQQQQQHHHQQLQYHLSPNTLPHVANLLPHQRAAQSFSIPDTLCDQLLKRNEATTITTMPKDSSLPEQVHVYHSLQTLEDRPGKILGNPSWSYKAMSRKDGKTCVLVRVAGFRLVNEQAMSIVKRWCKVKHSSIVAIREAFTTRAFGDSSLIFVYDYHPCSITLYEAYFTPQAQALLHARFQAAGGAALPVPETTLWSFITQISSALKVIHSASLSARTIDLNKILMTSKNRLRINGSGILDVLQYDGTEKTFTNQQEDLISFGKLIITLACNSMDARHDLPESFDYISRFYSPDLKNVILYLLGKPFPTKAIDHVITMIGPRILHEMNSSQYYTDALETNLVHELENARLVRLLSKLGFINERPEQDNDPSWSETGDKYVIKLFRDYLFHQVNDMGVPVVDIAHVITCLNKLDTGVDETIQLVSRDEQTSILVSYKELKGIIASAFNDVYTNNDNTKQKQ
ncbi:hypothetical protein K501DRAFT_289795 [Backusella circina FSU 941]|nr:hypothetical protein K501DRAFT_289795 [Backusella circina FSU 941]